MNSKFVALLLFVGMFTLSESTKCSRSAVRPRRSTVTDTMEGMDDPTSSRQGNPLVSYGLTQSSDVLYNQWLYSYDVPSLPVVEARFGYAAARLVYVPNRSSQEPQSTELLVVHGGRVSRATRQIYIDTTTEVSDQMQFLTFTLNTGVEVPISVGNSDGSPGGRYLHTAVSFPALSASGRPVVFYGGLDKHRHALGSVWHLEASRVQNEGLHWSSTGEGPRRCGHSSVSLGNNMLVFGGCNQTMCMNDVYSYNVVQRTWVEVKGTGKIPSPRGGHIAIAVEQANLMFIHGGMEMPMARGSHSNYSVFGDTYVFDIKTKMWQHLELTPPTSLTITHAASVFFQYSNYGRWVVYGIVGRNLDDLDKAVLAELTIQLSDGSITSGWEIKNESQFLQFPNGRMMTTLISFSTSTGDQIAYMIGGAESVKSSHHQFYDPLPDVWLLRQRDGSAKSEWIYVCATSEHPEPRAGQTVTVLDDGPIALFGGVEKKFSFGTTFASSVWQVTIKNRNVNSWKKTIPTSRLLAGVVGHSSVGVFLSTGESNDTAASGANTILTFGGFSRDTVSLENRITVVAPNLLYWHVWSPSKSQPSPCPRAFHSLVIHNLTLYLFGGLSDLSSMNSSALNDTWSLRWSESWKESKSIDQYWTQIVTNVSSPPGRFGHSAVTHYNEGMGEFVMLMFGGTDGMTVFNDVWQLSLSTLTWKQLVPSRVDQHAKTNSRIIRVFGHSASMIGHKMVVYGGCNHPHTNNFLSLTESLPSCPQSYVLGIVASFDTQSNRWTIVDIIGKTIPRYFHSALFQSSHLFIFGGLSGTGDLYDGTFAIRLGCNKGYEGNFPNGTCVPCPKGYYGSGGGKPCQKCDIHRATNGTAKASKTDCTICSNDACGGHGKCKFDENDKISCDCDALYGGTYCQTYTWYIVVTVGVPASLAAIYIGLHHVKRLYKLQQSKAIKYQRITDSFEKASCSINLDKEIKLEGTIGKGGYGIVKRGKYRHHADVAVKMLKPEDEDMKEVVLSFKNSLKKELECLRNLHHLNIAKFYGAGHDERTESIFLVTELVQPGSLHDVLHELGNDGHVQREFFVPLTDRVKVNFCMGICSALKYLRDEKLYIHWDLNPNNVLVSIDGEIKLIDFGVSKNIGEKPIISQLTKAHRNEAIYKERRTAHITQDEATPLVSSTSFRKRTKNCYLAPEFFRKNFTIQSDIYR